MKLDDFESVFRSAVKERFHYAAPTLASALLVTDLPDQEAHALQAKVDAFLATSSGVSSLEWQRIGQGEYQRVGELLEQVVASAPDLIVTYRHLLRQDKEMRHSLGSFVDTMSQATKQPVLLLPPITRPDFDQRLKVLKRVLVVTDHIVRDERLVRWGVHLCPRQGTVVMAHVEDDVTFKRYAELLAMIPDAPTETLLARLEKKLLGRPADYIGTIVEALAEQGVQEEIVPVVTMGHALSDYKRIIDEHEIDLVVMNTKDEHQHAMHGMAYAIAVEVQDRPLLLL